MGLRVVPAFARVSPEFLKSYLRLQFKFWQEARSGDHPDKNKTLEELPEHVKSFIAALVPMQFEVCEKLGAMFVERMRFYGLAKAREEASRTGVLRLHFVAYHEGWWHLREMLKDLMPDTWSAREDDRPSALLSEEKISEGEDIAWGFCRLFAELSGEEWAEFKRAIALIEG